MLVEYVRNTVGAPIACVVATSRNEIGWSACNPKDKFDKHLAREIAEGRAKRISFEDSVYRLLNMQTNTSEPLRNLMFEMAKRANRYFKMTKSEI